MFPTLVLASQGLLFLDPRTSPDRDPDPSRNKLTGSDLTRPGVGHSCGECEHLFRILCVNTFTYLFLRSSKFETAILIYPETNVSLPKILVFPGRLGDSGQGGRQTSTLPVSRDPVVLEP